MTKKPKFKKRYVLGEGRPHFYYKRELAGVIERNHSSFLIGLSIADELEDEDVPIYSLELVRVDGNK